MKKLLIFIAAIALLGGAALWFVGKLGKENSDTMNSSTAIITLKVHTEDNPNMKPKVIMKKTTECLTRRLERFIPGKFTIETIGENKLKVTISPTEHFNLDSTFYCRISKPLSIADLQFRTTLPNYEVWNAILEAEQKDTINNASIASLLSEAYGGSACLGCAHHSDTAKISQMFRNLEAQNLLTGIKVKPMWSAKPTNGKHELVAIYYNGAPELDGNAVSSARANIGQCGSAEVSLEMNRKGAKKWKDLTGSNVGKQIAIILDGLVYSYPMVNQRIEAGMSTISGNFTIEEAQDLANVLECGKLPVRVSILDITQ